MPTRIMVLEDDASLSEALCGELAQLGHAPSPVRTAGEGSAALKSSEFDVALLDLAPPDGGLDLLRQILADEVSTEAIVLTRPDAMPAAVEAMRRGAYGYLTRPPRPGELAVLVDRAAEKARLRRDVAVLRARLQPPQEDLHLLTQDPAMQEALASLERAAGSDLPVLIEGQSGTGMSLAARALHRASPRAGGPFVTLDCRTVPEDVLESRLFGRERDPLAGAEPGPGLVEAADQGLLFLDEVGRIGPPVQARLLRALESGEFQRVGGTRRVRTDLRVVSASTRDLRAAAEAGGFRPDLYRRLAGLTLRLPSLRERPADVALLARHFLDRAGSRKELSPRALKALQGYAWPGNVSELEMVVRRAVWLSASEAIESEDLRLEAPRSGPVPSAGGGLTLAEMERAHIENVLRLHDGHRGRAARALGIDPKTLYNKLGASRPRAGRAS